MKSIYWKYSLLTIFIIIFLSIIVNYFVGVNFSFFMKSNGDDKTWISYFGSIIGSLIGGGIAGIVAYNIAKIQVNDQKENSKKERKEQIRKEIQVATSDHFSELAHKLYKSLSEKQKRARNMIEIYYSRHVFEFDVTTLYYDNNQIYSQETKEILNINSQISAFLFSKRLVLYKFHKEIIELLEKMARINMVNVDMGAKLFAIQNALNKDSDIGKDLDETVEFFNNEYILICNGVFTDINRICVDIQKDFLGELFEHELENMSEISSYFNSEKLILKKIF
jgi:hypothetical protein